MLERLKDGLTRPGVQLAVLLLFALLYRMNTFGHPNMDSDEALYFLFGQYMHDGYIPYVDIWDRKPAGLFVLYYLFAGISDSVLAYQIPAWLSVGVTAWIIARIVAEMAHWRGGLLAGISYITFLPIFLGWGGQAPVFYNLPVTLAAYLVVKAAPNLRSGAFDKRCDIAMVLCGLALTMKQTVVVEASIFGLYCVFTLWRAGADRKLILVSATRWMVWGIMPSATIALVYLLIGHWSEFYHAMVLSNLAKQPATWQTLVARLINLYLRLLPLLCASVIGLVLKAQGGSAGKNRDFLLLWYGFAWLGFLIVPNLYPHYILPVLVPVAVAAGLLYSRKDIGLWLFTIVTLTTLQYYRPFVMGSTIHARQSLASLERSIRAHDSGGGLFIFDGPVLLYSMTGHQPMTPLALPLHLNYAIEENVSHLDTLAEVKKVLSQRPSVVLITGEPRNDPPNEKTYPLVRDYIFRNCRLVDAQWTSELFRTDPVLVYGDCASNSRLSKPNRHPIRRVT